MIVEAEIKVLNDPMKFDVANKWETNIVKGLLFTDRKQNVLSVFW